MTAAMRVLIVEDEHKIANSIKQGLLQETYAVDVAFTGTVGYDLATTETYDLIILDLMLPGIDGVTICTKLRTGHIHTPILMLTAKGQLSDKVEGLNAGADDYLTKPFAFEELLARVRALARRPRQVTGTVLEVDDLSLDTISYEVVRAGRRIPLTSREFALLEFLMRHPDQTVSKDTIIAHVWNYDAEILPNTIEVYVGYLRNKIDKAFPKSRPLFHTVRGFGYRLGEG